MITLDHPKLLKLLLDKDTLVTEGRKISGEIERIENKIKNIENKEKAITAKVIPPQELIDKGEALVKQITDLNTELTKIANKINESKLDAVPQEMKDEHMQLFKDKEKLERDRNKIALKVQKIKDKAIPIVQKEVKPLLKEEYDDIETAKVKDSVIVINTFNHLEDWKKAFKR